MELCKNEASGKYFIFIDETGDEEALFVTSDAKIKSLKMDSFTDPEEYPDEQIIKKNMVSEDQLQRFHEYKRNRSEELSENMLDYIKILTPIEKKLFIEKLQRIYEESIKKS